MGCIENQRSSPAPPPDDPSDKPMGEMLLNAGAGSGDGMCAQVSSVPGLQMLLLTQVRVVVIPACWCWHCWCWCTMQWCWPRHAEHGSAEVNLRLRVALVLQMCVAACWCHHADAARALKTPSLHSHHQQPCPSGDKLLPTLCMSLSLLTTTKAVPPMTLIPVLHLAPPHCPLPAGARAAAPPPSAP